MAFKEVMPFFVLLNNALALLSLNNLSYTLCCLYYVDS